MAALPKRRISTGRQGRRRQDKVLTATGQNRYVGSRARRAAKKGTADESKTNE